MGSSNRRPYLTATVLDQALLDACADHLDFRVEMVADVYGPTTIRISDRNKYVGSTFYGMRTEFPVIRRTMGEWLSPELEFSRLELGIWNPDGVYNPLLPGGANFAGWIGRVVDVRIGIAANDATYRSIYKGRVTDVAGFQRERTRVRLITRDETDRINKKVPGSALTREVYNYIEDSFVGVVVPIIYGDWTVAVMQGKTDEADDAPLVDVASIPAIPVNGTNPGVLDGSASLDLVVACHEMTLIDQNHVYVQRGDVFKLLDSSCVAIGADNSTLQILNSASFDGGVPEYVYKPGDKFFVRCKGKYLGTGGALSDNIVAQARDMMESYGSVDPSAFHANWATYRDKSTPTESAISTIKSRVWIQDQEELIRYVLSMLEQVRLEMFVDAGFLFKLSALHFDEFEPDPEFVVRQWDVKPDSFAPALDDRNSWNRAQADYSFEPTLNANSRQTAVYRNQDAIDQAGKEISKKVVFPNLYVEADVTTQLTEMLKLASGYAEMIEMTLTPRAMLRELGEFVRIDVAMGSTVMTGVPAMIREIGYDANGPSVPMKVWSFQMIPFPGHAPTHPGIVGGSTATITQE